MSIIMRGSAQDMRQRLKMLRLIEIELNFAELLYLLLKGNLSFGDILFWLSEMHPNEELQSLMAWKSKEQNSILDTASHISQLNRQQNWKVKVLPTFTRQLKKQNHKTLRRKQILDRIDQLQVSMDRHSFQSNISRLQEQKALCNEQYLKAKKQYTFLKNYKNLSKGISKYQKIVEISKEYQENLIGKKAKIDEKILQYENNESKLEQNQHAEEKFQVVLKTVFDIYSKMNARRYQTFQKMGIAKQCMRAEDFLRFMGQYELLKNVRPQEALTLFKHTAKVGQDKLSEETILTFEMFAQLMKQIHSAIKTNKSQIFSYSQFQTSLIKRFQENLAYKSKPKLLEPFYKRKQLSMLKHYSPKHFIQNRYVQKPEVINSPFSRGLRGKESSKYHYLVQGHTGKLKDQMQKHLKQNRRNPNKMRIKTQSMSKDNSSKQFDAQNGKATHSVKHSKQVQMHPNIFKRSSSYSWIYEMKKQQQKRTKPESIGSKDQTVSMKSQPNYQKNHKKKDKLNPEIQLSGFINTEQDEYLHQYLNPLCHRRDGINSIFQTKINTPHFKRHLF